jgi:tetratricopeptide (TPR) repeat protein
MRGSTQPVTDASGWAYRGDQFAAKGDLDRAISDYNEAIQRQPTWMWPLQDRGNAYQRNGQLDLALQDFNRVIQVAPNLAIGYLGRASIYGSRTNWDLAVADYQKAAQLDPGNTSIQTSLQQAQSSLQQAQSARQAEFDEYSRWFGVCFGSNSAPDPENAIAACDQALNYKSANATDRSRLATRRADLQRQAQDVATFQAQWENCRAFIIQSCDTAIQSPKATAQDRAQLIAWRAVRQKFDLDVASCREGSIPACDMALASAAASTDDQQYLRDWRAAASPWAKALAFLHSSAMSVVAVLDPIPASTLSAAAIAALLAALLVFVLLRQRRHRRAPDFAMAASRVAGTPPAGNSGTGGTSVHPFPPASPSDAQPSGPALDREGIKKAVKQMHGRREHFEI